MKKIFFPFLSILLFAYCTQNTKTENTGASADSSSVETTTFNPANVNEQAIYSRAFNAVVWGMPTVNSELMYQSLLQAKGDYNQLSYWSGLINSKNQTLTPNPDVIYLNP